MGMEPTQKSPQMTEFLEALTSRSSAIKELKCIKKPFGCERTIEPGEIEVWDELTRKEYRISGMCNTCQDAVFLIDEGEEDEWPEGDAEDEAPF